MPVNNYSRIALRDGLDMVSINGLILLRRLSRPAYYAATVGVSSRGVRFSRAAATTITIMENVRPGKEMVEGEKSSNE
jgi:hypothetical protein